MSKAAITRLFAVAVAAVVAGVAIGIVAVVAALADGAVAMGGPQVVTVSSGPFASAVGALIIASLLTAAGTVAAIASWIGALVNTSRLADKTWFVGLLVLGLFSLGWVAMVAYVFVGPDSTTRDVPRPAAESTSEAS